MSKPNRVLANARRVRQKLDSIGASNAAEAERIAAEKRLLPNVIVRVSRYRIGPRSERWYQWQVHVYAKPVKEVV